MSASIAKEILRLLHLSESWHKNKPIRNSWSLLLSAMYREKIVGLPIPVLVIITHYILLPPLIIIQLSYS